LVLASAEYPTVAMVWANALLGEEAFDVSFAPPVLPPLTLLPSNNPGDDMGVIRMLRMELRFFVGAAEFPPPAVVEGVGEGDFGNCRFFVSLGLLLTPLADGVTAAGFAFEWLLFGGAR
jgi:hypothetical protein